MMRKIAKMLTVATIIVSMLLPSVAMAKTVDQFTDKLPTSGFKASAPMQTVLIETSNSKGKFECYDFFMADGFITASATVKKEIKNKTKSLCKGKKNDYDKAQALSIFIQDHMKYEFSNYDITTAWNHGVGNCMTYAELTAAMLYYAGIPNGYVYGGGHIFNIALCDGRWIPIDSQGVFDRPADEYGQIDVITIMNNKMVYVVDDLKVGIKLAQVGAEATEVDKSFKKNGITIPAWVKGYYVDNWLPNYPKMIIRGTKGTAAERLVNEFGFRKITYKGKKFTAKRNASVKIATPKTTVKAGKKKFIVKYKKVTKSKGVQIGYKKAGANYKFKRFVNGKSLKKTVNNLKAGQYNIKVRAYKKTGSTYHYSKWTKVKKVVIK